MLRTPSFPVRVIVSAAILLSCSTAGLRADAALRWKFEKGNVLQQVMESKATSHAKMGGMDMSTTQEMIVKEVWTIKDVHADGSADIAQKTTSLQLKMEVPMQGVLEYNSKAGKKIQGPLGQMLNGVLDAMAKGEVTFRLSPEGKASDIRISSELKKAFETLKGSGQVGGGMFSEQWFEQMFQFMPLLPGKAVAEGTSWDREAKVPMPFGALQVHSKYTYKGGEAKDGARREKIHIESTMSLVQKPGLPMQVEFKSSEGTGEAFFDAEMGCFTEILQTQKIKLEMKAGQGGGPVVSTTESKTKITFSDKKPAAGSSSKGSDKR